MESNNAIPHILDPSHPLFLHHSDSPGTQLVSRLLEGSNYGHWCRAIIVALTAKKKLGFVLGTCKRPEADQLLQNQWDTCNSMVTSWLLNALKPKIAESVMYAMITAKIWRELKQRFGQPSGTKIFNYKESCVVYLKVINQSLLISFKFRGYGTSTTVS
ncbi:hypothetical protein Ancab_040608 [Ancistrocladus abbreviatus]